MIVPQHGGNLPACQIQPVDDNSDSQHIHVHHSCRTHISRPLSGLHADISEKTDSGPIIIAVHSCLSVNEVKEG